MPVDARGFQLVGDVSQSAGNLGSFVSQKINERLQQRALGGEDAAMARLSSRDPRAAMQIGSILKGRKEDDLLQAEKENELVSQRDEFKRRIARSFVSATSDEARKSVLQSVLPTLKSRPGFESLIADIEDDIARYDSDPNSVNQEYAGANVLFDTQDQLKVGARKIFNDGTILQSTPQGPRVFSPSGELLQGQPAQAQLKSAFDNEVVLSGAKAGAAAGAKQEAENRQLIIEQGLAAKDMLKDTNRLLELNEAISTGKTAKARKFFGDLFGVTDPDLGEFNAKAGQLVLGQIRQLGANPTEGERAFLTQITPSIEQGGAVNKALLEGLKDIQKRQVDRAKWFARPENRGKTTADYLLETDTEDFSGTGGDPVESGEAPKVLRFDNQGNLIQ